MRGLCDKTCGLLSPAGADGQILARQTVMNHYPWPSSCGRFSCVPSINDETNVSSSSNETGFESTATQPRDSAQYLTSKLPHELRHRPNTYEKRRCSKDRSIQRHRLPQARFFYDPLFSFLLPLSLPAAHLLTLKITSLCCEANRQQPCHLAPELEHNHSQNGRC